jgi:chromosome segregation ATPase
MDMDTEQLEKRFEYLDGERRKDHTALSSLQDRLIGIEGTLNRLLQEMKETGSELSRLKTGMGRFDQVDGEFSKMRLEFARMLEANEKQRHAHEIEMDKVRRNELDSFGKSIAELKKSADMIGEIKKGLQERVDAEYQTGKRISDIEATVQESLKEDEESGRMLKMLDENRRQDSKRLADLTGELAGLRKRVDEQRGIVEMASDTVRKLDLKMSELQAMEIERRQTVSTFIEKQNLAQVEKDRAWGSWETRFQEINKQSADLQAQLEDLDATHRALKRSQEAYDEVTQKFERRINELTEMQRLADERFRQEWVTYKSDDQKRWTNNILSQEELQREVNRLLDKTNERVTVLEDLTHELQDTLHQMDDQTKKQMQSLMTTARQWLEDYERALGRQI